LYAIIAPVNNKSLQAEAIRFSPYDAPGKAAVHKVSFESRILLYKRVDYARF
jgi:hypothetical protein